MFFTHVRLLSILKVMGLLDLKFLYLTWNDVQRLAEEIADKIKEDEYKPDILIAVSRGGLGPARIISDQLNNRKLASLQINYYSGLNEKLEKPEVLFPLNADVRGLKVLVIDDVSDSGHSLIAVKKYVEEKGAAEVKLATLHYKPWSRYKPDYFAEEVERWILYPWEPNESIQDLIRILKDRGVSEAELHDRLREIGYTEHELHRYLRI